MRNAWLALMATSLLVVGCSPRKSAGDMPPSTVPSQVAAQRHDATPGLALPLLLEAIGERRLVLLGEMHGTQETPALVADLAGHYVAAQRPVVLALEITTRDQALVDRYLASPGSAVDRRALLSGEHWKQPMHDGRDSLAMLALIEQARTLHTRGGDIAIALFDAGGREQRDLGMARELRAIQHRAPNATLLVLTGNVHAMTRMPPWDMFDGGKRIEPPMTAGRHLSDLHPLSIDIRASSGDMWVCTQGKCGRHRVSTREPQPQPTLDHNAPGQSAWDATLTLPSFTASLPAVLASTPYGGTVPVTPARRSAR